MRDCQFGVSPVNYSDSDSEMLQAMIYKKQVRGMLNIHLWTNDLCYVFDTQLNKVGSSSKLILIFSTKQHTGTIIAGNCDNEGVVYCLR